ncbi:phosphatase PAP2 family protein [Candidatus Daviesbacteria bacterium]|nr:phosphatase PAP2 family protein [Candidatus Daviesbacteria bacterium]
MKHKLFNISLFIAYILAMTALMIWQGIGIAPDRYAFVLLLGSLLIKKTRAFLFDWLPFLFILLSYDFLRGFADNLAGRVHINELIEADKWLFGQVPTLTLQAMFYNPDKLGFLDFVATVFYFLHFALPLAFGYILWIYNRAHFKKFTVAILLLSYAGWVTYLSYPAAPPWMASNENLLPKVYKIMDKSTNLFPDKFHLPTIYHQFNPNPVAAIPSLHAAYPLLVLLLSLYFFGIRALWFSPYVAGVWLSIVYLGEHYAVDVLIGAVYATVFFFMTLVLYKFTYSNWMVKKFAHLETVAKVVHNNVKSLPWQKKETGS